MAALTLLPLEGPYDLPDRNEKYTEVRDNIDDPAGNENSVMVYTMTRDKRIPDLLSWYTREDSGEKNPNIGGQIEPYIEMDEYVQPPFAMGHKNPYELKQDG
ncbi:MAG: hypothetical protein LQ342_003939 [Letrouitia transgressa]|nr:MAG: hypothetical protein LQ342_003939 [Letrouitia transgressa]